jgi:hypothetical protein
VTYHHRSGAPRSASSSASPNHHTSPVRSPWAQARYANVMNRDQLISMPRVIGRGAGMLRGNRLFRAAAPAALPNSPCAALVAVALALLVPGTATFGATVPAIVGDRVAAPRYKEGNEQGSGHQLGKVHLSLLMQVQAEYITLPKTSLQPAAQPPGNTDPGSGRPAPAEKEGL